LSEHDQHAHEIDALSAQPRQPGLVRKSIDALNGVVGSLKKQDTAIAILVETFTAEMTLVAEGLNEDLTALEQQVAQLSAQQTLGEDRSHTRHEATMQALNEMHKRVEALEKKAEKHARQRGTVTQALRQATWIAAILGAAWVITALLRTFGG